MGKIKNQDDTKLLVFDLNPFISGKERPTQSDRSLTFGNDTFNGVYAIIDIQECHHILYSPGLYCCKCAALVNHATVSCSPLLSPSIPP